MTTPLRCPACGSDKYQQSTLGPWTCYGCQRLQLFEEWRVAFLRSKVERLRNVVICARNVKCPRDTNGDNDCGRLGCPVCGPGGLKQYARAALEK